MLYGIAPLLSPDLVAAMMRMGHSDTLLFADANYPIHALPMRVIRADGISIADLLAAISVHFPLDESGEWNCAVMENPQSERTAMSVYRPILEGAGNAVREKALERYAFYKQGAAAYTAVYTGDTLPRGNLIIAKGVVKKR